MNPLWARLAVFAALFFCFRWSPAEVWPVEREWSVKEENAYSLWIQKLGSKAWRSIDQAFSSPQYNTLYSSSDDKIRYSADCGDLPSVLRAYYAYKRRLPFLYTQVGGGKYAKTPNSTVAIYDNLSHQGTVQDFFRHIPEIIHTGTYRTAPEAEDSLTYPVAISAQTLRPGVIFYSPEGHIGVVAATEPDGTVFLIDGHPDQSITRIRFSPKLEWRSVARTGGFRAFRKVVADRDTVRLIGSNAAQPGYSVEQHELGQSFYDEVSDRLITAKIEPLAAFERAIREGVHSEVLDRIAAVETGWEIGRQRPIPVPPNIYDATGDWEAFSTASRDMRLRRAMLQIGDEADRLVRLAREKPGRLAGRVKNPDSLAAALANRRSELYATLHVTYRNSAGRPIRLSLAEVERRMWRLSFDPNHPPELRWGATGSESATAPRSEARFHRDYDLQQPWRYRLEKMLGPMSPDDADNPRSPPR